MKTISYGEFSTILHQSLFGRRTPSQGTIEVTRRCPLTCAHCYNNLPMGDRQAQLAELTYDEHCRIVDEITEAGCFWLLYTGGEILARRDFLDIYSYARKKGLLITLFTNGILINEKVADFFAQKRPFSIEITLYGRTKETYEKLTGIPGSYDRCIKGIRLLQERNLPLKLKSVAVTINKHEVWDMKKFAEEELGVSFKFDAMMSPRIDCSQSPLAVRLKPEEIVALDLADRERTSEWKRFAEQFTRPAHAPDKMDELYHCGGGIDSFAIDPLGKMSICVLSHFDAFDLRKGSFHEGWDSFLNKVRNKKITRLTKCTECQIKAMCGMCPANGELENGDPESPVDFLCEVAHLRAKALDIPVPVHGECEYCERGPKYDQVMQAASNLQQEEMLKKLFAEPVTSTPEITASPCSSGGCSSCSVAPKMPESFMLSDRRLSHD